MNYDYLLAVGKKCIEASFIVDTHLEITEGKKFLDVLTRFFNAFMVRNVLPACNSFVSLDEVFCLGRGNSSDQDYRKELEINSWGGEKN